MKYFRIMSDLTLEHLSKGTNLSIGYLSHLEKGSRENPSKEAMEKIATALNRTVPEVFFTDFTAEEAQELAQKGHYVICDDGKPSKIEIEEGGVVQ